MSTRNGVLGSGEIVHDVAMRAHLLILSLLTACALNASPPADPSPPVWPPQGEAWPRQLPPNYAERRGVSRFPETTQQQARACAAGGLAFVVFEQDGRTLGAPECRYSVHITRDCWPGRCTATLRSVDGRETWAGPCRSTKGGGFHFEVTSSSGERGDFYYDSPRDEGSLRVGERITDGRIVK